MAAWPAHAAIAHVQAATCSGNVTNCTTGSITSTSGNLFVASHFRYNGAFTSVTDSKSNSYTATGAAASYVAGATDIRQDYSANATGGASHTFTLTTAADFICLSVSEISGAAASPLDQVASGVDDTAVNPHVTASTPTTTQANELLLGAGGVQGITTYITDTGSGWTEQTNIEHTSTDVGILTGTKVVSATGAYTFSWSSGVNSQAVSVITTFKETASSARQRCIGCGTDKKVIGE